MTLPIHCLQLALLCLALRYFGSFKVKSKLNPITIQTMANLDISVWCVQIIVFSYSFCSSHQSDILKLLWWNSKLNLITTQRMANLQNTATCLSIVVSSYSFCACCHHRDILKLLRLNSHSTSSRLKGRPICKILSHTWKSLFAASLMVLTITRTL